MSFRKQYLFVNHRLLRKTKLHQVIRDSFQRTLICKPMSNNPVINPESPTKAIKLHPVYIFKISCPLNEYDICLEPRKTLIEFKDWDFVSEFLQESLQKIFMEKNLYPPELMIEEKEKKANEVKHPTITTSVDFDLDITGNFYNFCYVISKP